MADSRAIPAPAPDLTRRQALQLGVAAGLTAFVGLPGVARAASGGHLVRASYRPLVGQPFQVGGSALKLLSVEDVAGALGDPRLRGHDDAFALTFLGAPGVTAVTQTVTHPALGTHAMFITPVGAPGPGGQQYEVVVDRSVGKPADPPAPTPGRSAPPERPGSDEAAAAALAEVEADIAKDTRARTRRIARARARKGRRQRTTGSKLLRTRAKRRPTKRRATRRRRPARASARRS